MTAMRTVLLTLLLLLSLAACFDSGESDKPPINTTGNWSGSFELNSLHYDVAMDLQQDGWSISGNGMVGGYYGKVSGIVRLGAVDLDFYSHDTVQCCFLNYCYESEYMKLYFTGDIVDGALVDKEAYLSTHCTIHAPFYLRLDRQ